MVNQTLTIENGANGTTSPAAGAHVYLQGSTVVIESIPSAVDYGLDHWTVDTVTSGTANSFTITMDADYTVKAFFSSRVNSPRTRKRRRNRR